MKKKELRDQALYTIMWSPVYPYDKYQAIRVLPELTGILCILERIPERRQDGIILFYACWRHGLRMGLKNLMDPDFTSEPGLLHSLMGRTLSYKYCVIDSTLKDLKDIMYFLISHYKPELNNHIDFSDSGRYPSVYVREMDLPEGSIVERAPIA